MSSTDQLRDYYELDVTALVLADYQADPDTVVSSFRLQLDREVGGSDSLFQLAGPRNRDSYPQLVLSYAQVKRILGDFDNDGIIDIDDINQLIVASLNGLNPLKFDLNADKVVNKLDVNVWVKDLAETWIGDANVDGEFNSGDLVATFQAGKYEDAIEDNSTWDTGDWNADGEFTTGDLVVAFQDGGYETGLRPSPRVAAVPEPSSMLSVMLAVCGFVRIRPVRRSLSLCDTRRLNGRSNRMRVLKWLLAQLTAHGRRCRSKGQLVIGLLIAIFLGGQFAKRADAQIYRWDTTEVIPGTEDITPGPGVQLDHRDLQRAALSGVDLNGANFAASNLTGAYLFRTILTDANLSGADLTDAQVW
jgi:hypothetical protein